MPSVQHRHGLAECPGCGTALAAPLAFAGRSVTCKGCGTRFTLPSRQELFESAVAYLVAHDLTDDPAEREADEAAYQQIRAEAMLPEPAEPEAHQDPAWLG